MCRTSLSSKLPLKRGRPGRTACALAAMAPWKADDILRGGVVSSPEDGVFQGFRPDRLVLVGVR